jgi:hypothetical protein
VSQDPALRAGDADRDRVAEQLREHFAAGRLTEDELQERLEAAYSARTFGDLKPILADLPALAPHAKTDGAKPIAPYQAPLPVRRSGVDKALRANWTAWTLAVSVNLVIWVLVSLSTGDLSYFWSIWVAGPWGAVLITMTIIRRANRD